MTSSANRRRLSSFGLERLGVRAHRVGPPEAHDDIGDALLLEPADAVDGEGVDRDDMDLEVTVGGALLLAQLAAAARAGRADRPGHRRRGASRPIGPPAAAPAVAWPTDQDGQRLGRAWD